MAQAQPNGSRAHRAGKLVAGAALGCAPACYLLAQVLLLWASPGTELWTAAHIALFAWAFLLLPTLVGLGWYLWPRGPAYALIGGVLAAFGAMIDTLFTGIDFVSGVMARLDEPAAMDRLGQRIFDTLIMPLDVLDDTLPVGLLLLAIGLYRTRAAPRWPVAIVLAGLAIPGSELLKLLTGSLQVVGLGWLGWRLVSDPEHLPVYDRASRPRLAAIGLTALYLPAAPLASARAIMLVLVILLLLPELRADKSHLRADQAPAQA
jgi:hypothetical protein